MTGRLADWEKALAETAARYESLPFEWGRTDCAHFAADCILATTGRDVLRGLRNGYTSRLTGFARVRALGARDLATVAGTVFRAEGWPEGVPACAMAGDIGVTADDVLCVRFAPGFIARSDDGTFRKVSPARSWCIAWP